MSSANKKKRAELVAVLVRGLADLVSDGVSVSKVAKTFCLRLQAGELTDDERFIAAQIQTGLSEPNLKRWLSRHLEGGGTNAFIDKRAGRKRVPQAWDVRAAHLWANPSKRSFEAIAFVLRGEGYDVQGHQVSRYIKSLPASIASLQSPARIGKHLFKLNRKHFQRRHLDEVLVGEIYAGDGHTVDAYMAHPNTGGLYRPELTCFIDIKSRFIAGWWLSESETKESTLFALSSALTRNDHVPAWVYVDHGAGYRAKLMSDESTGWYAKFDIAVTAAIPGNPNGKSWIERFFRTVRDKHDKFFADGMMYCGDDMAGEINRRLSADLNKKVPTRKLPSFNQYADSLRAFIDRYHHEPMDVLGGRSPAQVWAELKPVPVGTAFDAVTRPSVARTVGHQEVRLDNRHYYAEVLAEYDGNKVLVEYDLHDDAQVWVRDLLGRLICVAKLAHSVGVISSSRLEEQRDRREQGQIKRLERHIDEVKQRRADPITAQAQVAAIEALHPALLLPAAVAAPAVAKPKFVVDLLGFKSKE